MLTTLVKPSTYRAKVDRRSVSQLRRKNLTPGRHIRPCFLEKGFRERFRVERLQVA